MGWVRLIRWWRCEMLWFSDRDRPGRLVPFHTGKVLVGLRYEVPVRGCVLDADMYRLQTALLGSRSVGIGDRVLGFFGSFFRG